MCSREVDLSFGELARKIKYGPRPSTEKIEQDFFGEGKELPQSFLDKVTDFLIREDHYSPRPGHHRVFDSIFMLEGHKILVHYILRERFDHKNQTDDLLTHDGMGYIRIGEGELHNSMIEIDDKNPEVGERETLGLTDDNLVKLIRKEMITYLRSLGELAFKEK
ncbi:MAG: hypothetical protein WA057_05860 [Candidatus Magasanikiibacteriota bacterium]